jgi:predicted regulator of Ras-like GTPase activity (Roadblock/LC7/MglB family)
VSARQSAAPRVGAEQAERAVRRLEEMAADVRGCAVFTDGGAVLAASGDGSRQDGWRAGAAGLLAAADAARGEPAMHVHVATEDGEVLAVRHGGFAIVAVAERFTLASLLVFDIRTVLRELVAGTT